MKELETIRGRVEQLDRISRTTHSNNSNGDRTSTTSNYSMFMLGDKPVSYRTRGPAPIFDGNELIIVGISQPGLCKGLVCHNLTTGWRSPRTDNSFILIFVYIFIVFGLFTIVMPIFAYFFMVKPLKERQLAHDEAHRLLEKTVSLIPPGKRASGSTS